LLDRLHAENGQTLTKLCAEIDMTRQAATKHLALLEEANLVVTVRRGRENLHYLNLVPIAEIAERCIGKYERHRLRALGDLKNDLTEEQMEQPSYGDVTYMAATPKRLWQALMDAEFTQRYCGGRRITSDWKVGAPVRHLGTTTAWIGTARCGGGSRWGCFPTLSHADK
jgi:DNA-binding transcriptional ArsR family regulator